MQFLTTGHKLYRCSHTVYFRLIDFFRIHAITIVALVSIRHGNTVQTEQVISS